MRYVAGSGVARPGRWCRHKGPTTDTVLRVQVRVLRRQAVILREYMMNCGEASLKRILKSVWPREYLIEVRPPAARPVECIGRRAIMGGVGGHDAQTALTADAGGGAARATGLRPVQLEGSG